MKLTEQQLAQLFKQSKAQSIDSDVDSLLNSTDASDKRIKDVEKIANSNMLSASYQVINQLKNWSKSVSIDVSTHVNNELKKPSISTSFLTWLKPTLATAVLAVGVYFIIPNLDPPVNPIQASPNQTMFSGSFEKGKQQILPTKAKLKSDVIYKGGFG